MTVLVVDDNEVIAELVVELLQQDGVKAVAVGDPRDLLNPGHELWVGATVLLCDLRMPGVSGLEVLAVARSSHPHVYSIALTGYDDPEAREVLDQLADLVKSKPHDMLDVIEVIRNRASSHG